MKAGWEITGQSKICGVIGDPVGHTISPAMHNAAFKALNLDYVYVPFRVSKEDLPRAVEGLRAFNIRGVNITIPHKVSIIPLLDEIDEFAQKIGSVNVVVNDNGRLAGYNTDAHGFLYALLDQGVEPEGQKVVVLGAGGASRSICFALAERGASLTILNRTPGRAARFAAEMSEMTGHSIQVLGLNKENLAAVLDSCNLLINTTSVGMYPHADATLVGHDVITPHMTVVDIVYNPFKTKLLTEAEKAGARTISGIDMLIWQGALAFEIWTGKQAPINIMRKDAQRFLKSHEK
jgi:shikimate dehydrogenase